MGSVGTDIILLLMLVAVFAMAGVHHLLIWMRHTVAWEHVWFGVASLAAAGAAAIHCVSSPRTSDFEFVSAQHLPGVFAVAWLVAATWFTVKYATGDQRRRRAALLATLLLAVAWVGDLAFPESRHLARLDSLHGLLRVLVAVALVIMFWLLADGALRLWASARRVRAAVLGGLGLVLAVVALRGIVPGPEFLELPRAALFAFLVVVLLMIGELAGAVADGEVVLTRQRQELANASRLSIVGELTASIAHEINQPLGAILSNADAGEIMLENPDPPLDEIRKILGDIRRDGLRASAVIRHVRKLVRKRELELEELDANTVATDVIALLDAEARQRRIPISAELSPRPVPLRADRTLMEQVLINLMVNAMDAMEAMGAAEHAPSIRPPIVLGVSTLAHGEIEFRIVDAGPGIPAEHLARLFDSFHTSKSHGMGLGLSIARSIVEAHGGRIRAENNPDAGAKFQVTLPPYDELHD